MNYKIINITNLQQHKDVKILHTKLLSIAGRFKGLLLHIHQKNKAYLNKKLENIVYSALLRKDILAITFEGFDLNNHGEQLFDKIVTEFENAQDILTKYELLSLDNICQDKLTWLIALNKSGTLRVNNVVLVTDHNKKDPEHNSFHDQLHLLFNVLIPIGKKAETVTIEMKQSGHTQTCMHRPIFENTEF